MIYLQKFSALLILLLAYQSIPYADDESNKLFVIPRGIENYMYRIFSPVVARIAKENGPGLIIRPCFSPSSYRKVIGYNDSKDPCWLINIKIGIYDGSGSVPIYRSSLVSQDGIPIFELPEQKSGDETILIKLNSKRNLIISRHFSPDNCPVSVYLDQNDFPEVFNIISPVIGNEIWYCTLYFKDIDGDGNIDILVKKEIKFRDTRKLKIEREVFSYNEKLGIFSKNNGMTAEQIMKILNEEGEQLPHIDEYGPPFEEHGKVIEHGHP